MFGSERVSVLRDMRKYPAAATVRAAPTTAATAPSTPTAAAVVPATAATVLSPTAAAAQPHGHCAGQASGRRRRRRAGPVPRRRRPGFGDGAGGQRESDQIPRTSPVQNHQQDVREQQASHVVADGLAGSTTTTAAAAVRRLSAATAPATEPPAPAETGHTALGIRVQTSENHVDHDGCPATPYALVPQVLLIK